METNGKPKDDGLTLRQQNALPHLMTPGTIEEQAKNAGVSPRTLRRWFQDPKFQLKLKEAGEETMRLATTQLELISHQAVAVLHDSLYDPDAKIRLRAAQTLIRLGQKAYYGERLEQQVSMIEDAIAFKEQMGPNYN